MYTAQLCTAYVCTAEFCHSIEQLYTTHYMEEHTWAIRILPHTCLVSCHTLLTVHLYIQEETKDLDHQFLTQKAWRMHCVLTERVSLNTLPSSCLHIQITRFSTILSLFKYGSGSALTGPSWLFQNSLQWNKRTEIPQAGLNVLQRWKTLFHR